MESKDKFHPSLFKTSTEFIYEEEKEPVIPQNTLYDALVQTQNTPRKRHVTIFGFTQQNRENVIEQIERSTKMYRKEEGKNWISVWSDDVSSLDSILKLNHKMINGEMIGVYRNSFGIVEDSDIYLKKKGIFKKIYEYFLGE